MKLIICIALLVLSSAPQAYGEGARALIRARLLSRHRTNDGPSVTCNKNGGVMKVTFPTPAKTCALLALMAPGVPCKPTTEITTTPCTQSAQCSDIPACKKGLQEGVSVGGKNGIPCTGADATMSMDGWMGTAATAAFNVPEGQCIPCTGSQPQMSPNGAATACGISNFVVGMTKYIDPSVAVTELINLIPGVDINNPGILSGMMQGGTAAVKFFGSKKTWTGAGKALNPSKWFG